MRTFEKIISEICYEEGIILLSCSEGWLLKLSRDDEHHYILGHQFELNPASVRDICADKCATTEVVESFGIPCVRHELFVSPAHAISSYSSLSELTKKLKLLGTIVLKPNTGNSGKDVYKISNENELEDIYIRLMNKYGSLAACPYFDIQDEYRAVVIDREIKLVYTKQRHYVIGNGASTYRDLILQYCIQHGTTENLCDLSGSEYDTVFPVGITKVVNWKHNLRNGSYGRIIKQEDIPSEIIEIVETLSKGMNIRFASFDIIEYAGCYSVLEINSGVMLEHFAQQSTECYNTAKGIYREAIQKMFS